jgi:DNA-binding MarR family transcriptional regulator
LSAALRVTPRNITGLVDALEADGLVARSAHPSDRRATLVSLTEKGKATTAAMGRDQERFARELFADASSEELASLVGWLDRLLGRIRARLD